MCRLADGNDPKDEAKETQAEGRVTDEGCLTGGAAAAIDCLMIDCNNNHEPDTYLFP